MSIDFKGRVAIVTGAGGGLGRQHALALAARGARVVVNDLGGARDGSGASASAADAVVHEIAPAGGEAIANGASVTDFDAVQAMVAQAMDAWGRVDVLVNNAGILRDKSFAKMDLADFRLVLDVHLMGAVHCTKAVWPIMMAQKYGRIVMTTSSTGLYGNFGQTNYGAAKMALVGLMQTLALEGAKHDIRVNCLAPTAATRMTEDLLPRGRARRAQARGRGPRDARAAGAGCADAHHPVRRRRQLRGGARHADGGQLDRPRCRRAGTPCRAAGGRDRSAGRNRSRQRLGAGSGRGRQGDGPRAARLDPRARGHRRATTGPDTNSRSKI